MDDVRPGWNGKFFLTLDQLLLGRLSIGDVGLQDLSGFARFD